MLRQRTPPPAPAAPPPPAAPSAPAPPPPLPPDFGVDGGEVDPAILRELPADVRADVERQLDLWRRSRRGPPSPEKPASRPQPVKPAAKPAKPASRPAAKASRPAAADAPRSPKKARTLDAFLRAPAAAPATPRPPPPLAPELPSPAAVPTVLDLCDSDDDEVDAAAVDRISEMGFSRRRATAALEACGGDAQRALDRLLGGM